MEHSIEQQHPDTEREASSSERKEWKSLFRGMWADRLEDGDLLPVGGSMFSDELTKRLRLDFQTFDAELQNINPRKFRELFETRQEALAQWLEQVGPKEKIDPYLFFACTLLQSKVDALLQVSHAKDGGLERTFKYAEEKPPALSELRGLTMCAERAALTQFLLQRIGIESAYVGGATMDDARNTDEYPEAHSFIVIPDPAGDEATYIFDVARPRSQNNLPRLLKTDVSMTPELLAGKDELYVRSKEVLQGGELWFGVGSPVCGQHDVVEAHKE